MVTAVLLIGTVAWLVTVTNLVGAYGSGSIKPTALDLLAFMVLMAPGPKRVLALDGGGIRGIITIAFLKEIERVLKERLGGANDFRLCDYVDLVGGTSVGSLLAPR